MYSLVQPYKINAQYAREFSNMEVFCPNSDISFDGHSYGTWGGNAAAYIIHHCATAQLLGPGAALAKKTAMHLQLSMSGPAVSLV